MSFEQFVSNGKIDELIKQAKGKTLSEVYVERLTGKKDYKGVIIIEK